MVPTNRSPASSQRAIAASRHHQRHGANKLDETGSASEFLLRAMRRVIDEETARLEAGLTVLASIGSTAPFVGLFGTVWGVYHALIAIGLSGQGTLDKVAGPVGEALIMTAAGLAVAIPAVLAYNALVRGNRVVLAELDAFAHDLFAFLTTGSHVHEVGAGRCVDAAGARSPGRREMAFGNFERKGGAAPMAEINMIPLIDVMLVLLVIFIITAPLLTHAVKIDLPKATSAPNLTKPDHIARVDRRGRHGVLERRDRATRRARIAPASRRVRGNRSPNCTCAPIARRSTRRSPT